MLGQQASQLKRLAEAFSVPVVVTNQVAALMREQQPQQQPGEQEAAVAGEQGGGGVTAALGTLWAHAVNTRLVLEAREGERHALLLPLLLVRHACRTFWVDAGHNMPWI